MYLEKWYADCVSDAGLQIHYRANLRWGPATIGYRGFIGECRDSEVRIGRCGLEMPSVDGARLYWPGSRTMEPLAWTGAVSRPIELWRDGRRVLSWNPVVLNGCQELGSEKSCKTGYVEQLTLNFAPWHLGLDLLRWGRFCGQRHSLVWIEWQGRMAKQLVLLDGDPDAAVEIVRHGVRSRRAELSIGVSRQLLSEPLGSGALRALGYVRMLAAPRFLSGVETKWWGEAALTVKDESPDVGTVVYEEVVWP